MNSHGAQKKALGLKPAPSYNLRCLYGYVLRGLDIFLGWHAPQNTIPHIYDTNANFFWPGSEGVFCIKL